MKVGITKNKLFVYLKLSALWALSFIFLTACQDERDGMGPAIAQNPISIKIGHFPDMPVPADKPLSKKRVALGEKLFFDPILSRNNDISCSSCHLPQKAFTDGKRVSVGTAGRTTERNSPSLFNVAWQPYFFMDGGNPTLESQVLGPVENHNEMDLPFTEALDRVAHHPKYPELFQEAMGEGVNPNSLTTALATYQRILVSYNSAFDQYFYKQEVTALTPSEQNGLQLFTGNKLKCSQCHQLPLTTDFSFQNNGLYQNYQDAGRSRVTQLSEDSGKFKVPVLRNIELTAPYMHDGSFTTLEQVIDHYASGGENHVNKSPLVNGFVISAAEKNDLIAFLKSLTDTSSYQEYLP